MNYVIYIYIYTFDIKRFLNFQRQGNGECYVRLNLDVFIVSLRVSVIIFVFNSKNNTT